jgi:hypothetical protein
MDERADRYNNDKLVWSLADFDSLDEMIMVLQYGANKYAPNNWKKGLPYTETCDSLFRHMKYFLNGEDIDSESKLPHTGHILCNAMFLNYMWKYMKNFDDRYIDKNKLISL